MIFSLNRNAIVVKAVVFLLILDFQVFDFMVKLPAGVSKQGLPQVCQDPC